MRLQPVTFQDCSRQAAVDEQSLEPRHAREGQGQGLLWEKVLELQKDLVGRPIDEVLETRPVQAD